MLESIGYLHQCPELLSHLLTTSCPLHSRCLLSAIWFHPPDAVPAYNIFGLQRLFADLGGLSRAAEGMGPPALATALAEPMLFCEVGGGLKVQRGALP